MYKRSVLIPVLLGLGALLLLSGGLNNLQAQGKKFIQKGDAFPEIALKAPSQARDRTYLGLSGGDPFKIKDLKAEVILVEVFDVYCLPCQKQAPLYKQLFGLIQSSPAQGPDQDDRNRRGERRGGDQEVSRSFPGALSHCFRSKIHPS